MSEDEAKVLTHDEVWDDSALVTSWNEAYEEYKKYHSLAVKGEKVDESRTETDNAPNGTSKASDPVTHVPLNFIAAPAQQATASASTSAAPFTTKAPPGLANIPQTLLGLTQDENMKNLMMSWYYAGYYTGLYEGQQKAWAAMQEGG